MRSSSTARRRNRIWAMWARITLIMLMRDAQLVHPPGAARFGRGSDDAALLDDLQSVDWEDGLGRGFDLHGAASGRERERVAEARAVDGEVEHGAAAQEGTAGADGGAPVLVAEG